MRRALDPGRRAELRAQSSPPSAVLADDADQQGARAHRGDVAGDVGGPARHGRWRSTLITGIGASGEMRSTSP